MERIPANESPIRSALFVDFDNIYIGLSKTDPQAAERFATDPARWLAWLEQGLPAHADGGPPRRRSILIRRCYPNPDTGFRRYRSFFTSAAFSVIDCPSMTRTGKNSADIYMVMDIIDTLNHRTNFDEFIVFSGDSDFMPVLLRLRAHDRRTTTLAIDFMPPAYRAACDLVINEEDFIEQALGISHDGNCGGNGQVRGRASTEVLEEMAIRVFDAVRGAGEVAGADLPDILKDFRVFRESNNWLGYGTSQRLAEALVCSEDRLQVVRLSPTLYKITLRQPTDLPPVTPPAALPAGPAAIPLEAPSRNGERAPARASRAADRGNRPELLRLRSRVIETVKELGASSDSPILLARASQYVVSKLGQQVLETQWAGAGSFKRLLQGAENLGLEITTQPEPGYLFDPSRHTHPLVARSAAEAAPVEETDGEMTTSHEQPLMDAYPQDAPEAHFDQPDEREDEIEYHESPPSLEEFTRRVNQVTGAPLLTPHQYALIFDGIIEELRQIADGQKAYSTYQSSKAVSDWCAEHGEPIARSDVVLIFKGIIFQDGLRFSKDPGSYSVLELASVVRENVHALCRRSRMELSDYEERLLDDWILGDLEHAEAAEGGEPALDQEDAADALETPPAGPGPDEPYRDEFNPEAPDAD